MVEITLAAVDGNTVPKDLYLSLRIGEMQKFSKAYTARGYKFSASAVGERRYAKLELYKRVGMCSLGLDQSLKGTHEISVPVDDSRIDGKVVRYHVNLGGTDTEVSTNFDRPPADPTDEKLMAAREYLDMQQIEHRISDAIQAVLRERPEDAGEFVANMLMSGAGRLKKVDDGRPPRAATAPAVPGSKVAFTDENEDGPAKATPGEDDDLEQARQNARMALESAFLSEEDASAKDDAILDAARDNARKALEQAFLVQEKSPDDDAELDAARENARKALENAFLAEQEVSGDDDAELEAARENARKALESAFLDEDEEDHKDGVSNKADVEAAKSKAREALAVALQDEDEENQQGQVEHKEEVKNKARTALCAALLTEDDEGGEETKQGAEAVDVEAAKDKAREALSIALKSESPTNKNAEEVEAVKAKARDAMTAALLTEDSPDHEPDKEESAELKEAKENALGALMADLDTGNDMENAKKDCQDALSRALLTEDDVPVGEKEENKEGGQ